MNVNWSLARIQSITNKVHEPDTSPDDQLERCDMSTSTELPNGQEETSTKFPARPATHNQDTTGIKLLSRTNDSLLGTVRSLFYNMVVQNITGQLLLPWSDQVSLFA